MRKVLRGREGRKDEGVERKRGVHRYGKSGQPVMK